MSDDKKMEHNHDFDGIEELDNDLPRWWLGIFWVTSLLAVFYIPYYHFIAPEKLPRAALEADMQARADQLEAIEAEKPKDREAVLQARYKAGGWQESAKADFDMYCMACHATDGGGTIGPNFTDDYYIHGGTLTNIYDTISEGVPMKGMVSWKVTMKPEQMENLALYIRSLRGTTPAVAKAPEGRKVDEAGNFIEGEAPAEGEAPPAEPTESQ